MSAGTEKLLVTAEEAADLLGYDSVAQFNRAVTRGIFPRALDPFCRQPRWSWPAIQACLQPPSRQPDNDERELDKKLGLAG